MGSSYSKMYIGHLTFSIRREGGAPRDVVVTTASDPEDPFVFEYKSPSPMSDSECAGGLLELLNWAATDPRSFILYVKSTKPSKDVMPMFGALMEWSKDHKDEIMETYNDGREVESNWWVWALLGAGAATASQLLGKWASAK